jgi:hypothetical protein
VKKGSDLIKRPGQPQPSIDPIAAEELANLVLSTEAALTHSSATDFIFPPVRACCVVVLLPVSLTDTVARVIMLLVNGTAGS